ncbi:hypothetical protein PMAYCL1PPCAC_31682, partial [Pristionchus mayeri]
MSSCSFNRVDPCDNRCSSNSSCQLLDQFGTTEDPEGQRQVMRACVCDEGFAGEFCDRKVDCSSKPCLHEYVCFELSDKPFICICEPGYAGELCDMPIGLCTATSCENGGTCYNLDPLSTFCLCRGKMRTS